MRDFVQLDGRWPTQAQFETQVNQLLSRNAVGELDTYYVTMLPLHSNVSRLYADLTTITQQLGPSADFVDFLVWTVLWSIVLHQMWRRRNRSVFEQRVHFLSDATTKVVLTVFASHLRYLEATRKVGVRV